MNNKIKEMISDLTFYDKKNLSQKTLKLTEEVGELAKVILPYEDASGTKHRFVDHSKIMEECADVYLCLMSIVENMEFTEDDFEQMITRKAMKWADLQAREKNIGPSIPYEIHITVGLKDNTIEDFKQSCQSLKIKPILLDLQLKDDSLIKDIMTSSVVMGNNKMAYCTADLYGKLLEAAGYAVLRTKIETIPWHPAAPSRKHQNPTMPPNCYFESHLNVLCTNNRRELLKTIANKHNARQSQNVFKIFDDNSFTIMVTYRNSELVYEDFLENLKALKKEIIDNNFGVEKEIVEFSVYDTKISHDSKWINQ
jgi:NTP pyrophosphatase (non-canonical NTP hydrolase)